MKFRKRLDEMLVELGYFDDLKVARAWIMSHKVVVNKAVVSTPGTAVSPHADIHIRGLRMRFASRGGYKLERALQRFELDVAGRVCLDAGASTGGFTDCLIQNGAAKVYAVDVGYGQLRGKLAGDPRVVKHEKTNIGNLKREDFAEELEFASADLSYLSLRKAVPIIAALFVRPFLSVMLLKPLYEGLPQDEISNSDSLKRVLNSLVADLAAMGRLPSNACVSPILGGRGAVEFLLEFGGKPVAASVGDVVSLAFDDLLRSPPTEPDTFLKAQGE